MPTKQLTLTGTAQEIVISNSQRTALTIANLNKDDPGYISDDKGSGITILNSFPIFERTFVSLIRNQGDEPEKSYWGVAEGGKNIIIAIMEQFGHIPDQPPEYDPQAPFAPIDAPLMRPIT